MFVQSWLLFVHCHRFRVLLPLSDSLNVCGEARLSVLARAWLALAGHAHGDGTRFAKELQKSFRSKSALGEESKIGAIGDIPIIPFASLTFRRKLGSGGYAEVYLALWQDANVAVKVFRVGQGQQGFGVCNQC
jgi:hypothetical protein